MVCREESSTAAKVQILENHPSAAKAALVHYVYGTAEAVPLRNNYFPSVFSGVLSKRFDVVLARKLLDASCKLQFKERGKYLR